MLDVRRHDDDSVVDVPPYSLAWAELPAATALEIASSGALCMEITSRR